MYAAGEGGILSHGDGKTWRQERSGATGTLRALWGSGAGDMLGAGDAVLRRSSEAVVEAPAFWTVLEPGW